MFAGVCVGASTSEGGNDSVGAHFLNRSKGRQQRNDDGEFESLFLLCFLRSLLLKSFIRCSLVLGLVPVPVRAAMILSELIFEQEQREATEK
jgi:hypothetical protein